VINGAFMLTAGLLSIPAGLVADRIGRRIPVVFGITAVALSSLLIYLCKLPEQMAAVYVLFGAGLAAFAPAMLSLVADVMPVQQLGRAYGWYTTAIYTAMTIGPASGGFLAGQVGLRCVFLVSGGLSLMVALFAQVLLPDGSPRHSRSNPHAIAPALLMLLRNDNFTACLIATIGSCIGFGVFLTFLPLSATSVGLTTSHVGVILAAQAFTNVLCRIPIGIWADRVDQRKIVVGGLLFLSGALALLGQCVQFSAMIGCSILLGIGMALTYTAIGALIARLVPALQRGLAMGMYNSCIYVGMMTGSLAMGIALQAISYALGFAVAGGVALGSLVLFLLLSRAKDDQ
jgi:MFS family permease